MKPARRAWVAVATLAACTEPFEGEVHHTRYFEYHEQSDDALCPGLLDLLDEHAETIAAEIDVELEPESPIRYYRFRDGDAFLDADVCFEGAGSCADADGNAIYSAHPFNKHELAHAHTIRSWGDSIGLLLEGEAVALSCSPVFLDAKELITELDADWRDFVDLRAGGKDSELGYVAAGRFVTLLATRYGWDAVARLHGAMEPGSSAAELEVVFSALFPESIDAVWAEAMREDAMPCVEVASCPSRGPVELGADIRFECDGVPHQVLTVEPHSTVVIATTDCSFALRRCTTLERVQLRGCGDTVHWLSVPAGDYRFTDVFQLPSATVRVEQNDPSPLFAPTCSEARRIPLDPQASTTIFVSDTRDAVWFRIDGGGRTYTLERKPSVPSSDWMTFVCDDCGASGDSPCVFFEGEMTIGDGVGVWMLANESPGVVRSLHFTPVGQ